MAEIVTEAAAATGLVLSIYNTIQARRDKHPKLRVRVSFGFITMGGELSDEKVLFEIGNPWNQTITLASICIPLPNKGSLVFFHLDAERQMPVALTPGMSTRFWMNLDEFRAEVIKAGIRKFRLKACDALGNEYLSNSVSF